MLTTKRYDYLPFESIQVHPDVSNHRMLDAHKVAHYADDIQRNGLLEPLVVWERKPGQYFLVGGFHRRAAIERIRASNPGYFDRVDTRVVGGDLDEIRALNLKLNADRLDAKVTDYFDIVVYLNNANWSRERIAGFLDRSESWISDILRFVPSMDARVRTLLEDGKLTWSRAKAICRSVEDAPPGKERETLEALLASPNGNGNGKRKPLSLKVAQKRLTAEVARSPQTTYSISTEDLLALLLVIEGKRFEEHHLDRVRQVFPQIVQA